MKVWMATRVCMCKGVDIYDDGLSEGYGDGDGVVYECSR